MNVLSEWALRDQIQNAVRGKVDDYEFHALRSSVDNLERTVRELSATLTSVQSELSELQESVLNERT